MGRVCRQIAAVAKPALGRGLGNLLGDTQIADSPQELPLEPVDSAVPAEVSVGLGNILRAGKTAEAAVAQPEPEPSPVPEPEFKPVPAPDYTPLSIYKSKLTPPPAEAAAPAEPARADPVAPRWVLIAADLLLMALAVMLVFKSSAPMKAWEMAVCVAAVILGAILACLAALTPPRRD